VTLESVSVEEILEPLVSSGQAIAQDRQITLTSHIPKSLPPVQGNSKALREVFSNLIDNALKYTPEGGRVSISTQLFPATLEISIADTGCGIPREDREHLFERHYRGVQAQGEIPGTGLGLAIAKELIEQMGGTIKVIGPPSDETHLPGTVFTVSLPFSES
jgi:signal transduction histidine kinase